MANQLTISKQNGGYFLFSLTINGNVQEPVTAIRNDLLAVGNMLHFKSSNGANIIKQQNITPFDLTVIAGGTFTFSTITQVWYKLIEIGFFDWLGSGSSGVDRFDELADTFQYFGKDGQVCVVDESQLKIIPVPFYNYRYFTQFDDTPDVIVPDKMLVGSSDGTSLIFVDVPNQPTTTPIGTIFFQNNIPTATQTEFTIPENSKLISLHINNAFVAPEIRWVQSGTTITLLEITAETPDEVCFCLITI